MRHFPFKTLILCVLLPPVVYVFSIQLLEKTIQARYEEALAVAYTGDTRFLFDGSTRLQDAIRENIDTFLASRKLPDWGVRVTVTVKTVDGIYLYPDAYDDPKPDLSGLDRIAVARENFRLLNDGLIRSVEVKIELNTLISNLILVGCVTVALLVLFGVYRRSLKMSSQEDRVQQAMIDALANERQDSMARLEGLASQRNRLSDKIEAMQSELDRERHKATAAEDEMIDEFMALEDKISAHLKQQDLQLLEINALKEKLLQFEKENEANQRQLRKGMDAARKRFNTLYKNLAIHDRAVEGFVDLTEALKIKAEEVVHQLNEDPRLVQIKRKVFGKKNRQTVFEVIFAYKGRLYFRNVMGNRVEILVIGTKLTQSRDLAFLDKL